MTEAFNNGATMPEEIKRIFEGCSPECVERFHEFMKAQAHEIDVHKWIESEKAGKDLGNDAVMEWIKKYAKDFRKEWEETHGKVMNP